MLDMDLIEQHADQLSWWGLSRNKSLPWSEALIERYKGKWDWKNLLYCNGVDTKIFNSWTKQEISTALERIRSA